MVTTEPEQKLIDNIKTSLPELEGLLAASSDHWTYEDGIYRFYHQSFKVFRLQATTKRIVAALKALAPEAPLNQWFMTIVGEGTGKAFDISMNARWMEVTRPIVEAFFHARFMLEMVCRYARELEQPPGILPSGWATVLYLFDMR
jgi:hypothetical protein